MGWVLIEGMRIRVRQDRMDGWMDGWEKCSIWSMCTSTLDFVTFKNLLLDENRI